MVTFTINIPQMLADIPAPWILWDMILTKRPTPTVQDRANGVLPDVREKLPTFHRGFEVRRRGKSKNGWLQSEAKQLWI